jgi:hypothetical protein
MASILKVDTIQNTLGTEAMTISESGVPLLNVPAFVAYRSSTEQSVSSGAVTKVQLNATSFDTHGWFNTSSNQYIPQIAGYYQFNGSVYVVGTNLTRVQANLNFGSGNEIAGPIFVGTATTGMINIVSHLIYMNGTTNYVQLDTYAVGTSPRVAVSMQTNLSGFLVRGA